MVYNTRLIEFLILPIRAFRGSLFYKVKKYIQNNLLNENDEAKIPRYESLINVDFCM
jgi:hypothetical protein